MKKALTSLIALSTLSAGCATAGKGWTTLDTAAQVTFATALAVDWSQSQGITQECMEENPLIGPCGDRVPLGVYMPVTFAAALTASVMLPPKYRRALEGLLVGAELHSVWLNNASGY